MRHTISFYWLLMGPHLLIMFSMYSKLSWSALATFFRSCCRKIECIIIMFGWKYSVFILRTLAAMVFLYCKVRLSNSSSVRSLGSESS